MSDYGRISEELAKAKHYIAELEAKVEAIVERVRNGEPAPVAAEDETTTDTPA